MQSPFGFLDRYLPSSLLLRLSGGQPVPKPSADKKPTVKRSAIRWHVLLMPLFFIPIVTYWIIGLPYLTHLDTFVLATLLNFTMSGTCVLILDFLTQEVVRRYPGLSQTGPRVGWSFLVFLIVTPLFLGGGIFLYSHYNLFGYQYTAGLTTQILLYNVGANVLSVGIDETVYSLTKWREITIEREELKKINLQSQYESLKHQVNPHFLFNSLNSLSSLIADEPRQAEQFVAEMAKVYRYLLQTNSWRSDPAASTKSATYDDGELTTLAMELQFIQSYFHLLKTRYRAGIELKIDVPMECQKYRLPPLTLQMLIENAVKHNVIAANKPLLLEIITKPVADSRSTYRSGKRRATGDSDTTQPERAEPVQLLVRNNLQLKTTRVLSNQIGLTNIATKYRLLGQPEPIVRDDDGHFTIVLPLFLP